MTRRKGDVERELHRSASFCICKTSPDSCLEEFGLVLVSAIQKISLHLTFDGSFHELEYPVH